MGNLLDGVQGFAIIGDIGFKGSMQTVYKWHEWATRADTPTEYAPIVFVLNKVESEDAMIKFEKFKKYHVKQKFHGVAEMAHV